MKIRNTVTWLGISLVIILIPVFRCNGQGSGNNSVISTGYVEWVAEIPGQTDEGKTGFFSKLGKFIFGREEVLTDKPIALYAENSGRIIILDQKDGQLVEFQHGKARLVKIRRRKGLQFQSLVGISKTTDGDLLFTDSYLNKAFKISAGKNRLEVMNDTLEFNQPTGIAFSGSTNEIWVVESHAHRIAVLNSEGRLIKYIGSRGTGPGQFNFPTHLWINQEGLVFVLDAMNFRVQILNPDGSFQFAFGKQGDASGYFAMPKGIATDSFGNIYVADALFHTVQIFDSKGRFLYNFGVQGRGKSEFWMPLGIFVDGKDNIYVADTYNSRVQVFKLIMED